MGNRSARRCTLQNVTPHSRLGWYPPNPITIPIIQLFGSPQLKNWSWVLFQFWLRLGLGKGEKTYTWSKNDRLDPIIHPTRPISTNFPSKNKPKTRCPICLGNYQLLGQSNYLGPNYTIQSQIQLLGWPTLPHWLQHYLHCV